MVDRKYEESNLHLHFCKWVKREFPNDQFVRHEREGKRTPFMQNLFRVYNSEDDKLPDFEAFITNQTYHGFYIEFKKPGEKWLLRDCKTVKPQYSAQYKRHRGLWSIGRAVYFSSDLEVAKGLYIAFKENRAEPMQDYEFPKSEHDKAEQEANVFFKQFES